LTSGSYIEKMSSDKGRWLNRKNACTFHRKGLSKEKKKRVRDAASIQSTNWEEKYTKKRKKNLFS